MGHWIATCHLLESKSVDIINCDDVINRAMLNNFCRIRHIIVCFNDNDKVIQLLLEHGGIGIGVYTCVDTDDYNERLMRQELSRVMQKRLAHLLGGWIVHEPLEISYDDADI